ncbi:hypothetical protein [Cupriavidus sp. UYPR2.512]|nr:hypothetical protein [Cupriavidus sp. UYPR2.512]
MDKEIAARESWLNGYRAGWIVAPRSEAERVQRELNELRKTA